MANHTTRQIREIGRKSCSSLSVRHGVSRRCMGQRSTRENVNSAPIHRDCRPRRTGAQCDNPEIMPHMQRVISLQSRLEAARFAAIMPTGPPQGGTPTGAGLFPTNAIPLTFAGMISPSDNFSLSFINIVFKSSTGLDMIATKIVGYAVEVRHFKRPPMAC
jgi:hypothetical protein